MKRVRVIPVLLLQNSDLVKTTRFRDPVYVGDPINAVRIFNEKRVDEIILLDISERRNGELAEQRLGEIASEAFMPMAYGGGIQEVRQVERILKLGVEKVVLNSAAMSNPALVTQIARQFGSQSVVVSIDARRRLWFGYRVFGEGGRKPTSLDPATHAKRMEDAGAGELLITSIAREGTLLGYDISLVRTVSEAVRVPVIACGGAGEVQHFAAAVQEAGASAVAASSMFVFHGKHRAVLISFPDEAVLRKELYTS